MSVTQENRPVTQYQIELLQHTLGINCDRREPYRNYFVASTGHSDFPHLDALVSVGLMERRPAPKFLAAGSIVFAATDAGRITAIAALPEPKPRTRFDDFLDYDHSVSFAEYLCGDRAPSFELRVAANGRPSGKWGYEYRMVRCRYRAGLEVIGEWKPTKKEAKASYKAALLAQNRARRAKKNAA
ncbi:hypothetical protein [Burkholderia gladioli]|uniref:hypothetical protein n=1 Tax=Burkholderia gladioli TaxID=28095 RepID=UPI00163E02B2|nr:hypothetical protein [Burkholderia gladioli]